MKKHNPYDLTARNKDYAIFLPSISGYYAKTLAGSDPAIAPDSFEHGLDGFDFLKPKDNYFSYKWGLYSAGHACLDTDVSDEKEAMIQKRDRKNSFIVGDSGGFQIITGVIKCDWSKFKTDDTLRTKILNWMEHTADYSMVMDVPTMSITPNFTERTGLTTVDECLDYTMFNNDWTLKHRQGKTKFLNAMQGRSVDEALYWYDNVKHYPFEGFGFGGSTKNDLHVMLRLLLKMREDKQLDERDYLHFLGISKPEWAVFFTAIKRALRETANENLEVSYDAASAFICATKGQQYKGVDLTARKFGFSMIDVVDNKLLSDSNIQLPWRSPIYDRMDVSDICHHRHGTPTNEAIAEHGIQALYSDKELMNDASLWEEIGTTSLQGKVTKTSWNTLSYLAVMAHNVYVTIDTLQAANASADISRAMNTHSTDHLVDLIKAKKTVQIDAFTPLYISAINEIIHEVFHSETPYDVLKKYDHILSLPSPKTAKTDNMFNSLFD